MEEERVRSAAYVALIICVGFLCTSTGWISWLYRIVAFDTAMPAGFYTMVCGYVAQALGIGIYALLAHDKGLAAQRRMVQASLACYLPLLIPSTVVGDVTTTVACGLVANVPCGFIQGAYLHLLAQYVSPGKRGTAFGCAYAVSTLLSWMLSLPAGGALTAGVPCLVACCLMAGLLLALLNARDLGCMGQADAAGLVPSLQAVRPSSARAVLVLAGMAVVASSLVKTAGFSFPASDLTLGVSLELSRLLYGLGLVAAGLASDYDRRYGLCCCAMVLVMPFLMLALSGYGASGILLWSLGYFLTGFYTLFRVLLMVDLADWFCRGGRAGGEQPAYRVDGDLRGSALIESVAPSWSAHLNHTSIAVSGLLLGRIGDALGTALCLALSDAPILLIAASAVVFVATMALFLVLYQWLYAPESVPAPFWLPLPAPVAMTPPAVAPPSTCVPERMPSPAATVEQAPVSAEVPAPSSSPTSTSAPASPSGLSSAAPLAPALMSTPTPPSELVSTLGQAPTSASVLASATTSVPAPTLASHEEPQVSPAPGERATFERFASTYGLTARERDVLRLVLEERSNSEIAGTLFISEATVKYHVGNLLKKTSCNNRLEILTLYALTPQK